MHNPTARRLWLLAGTGEGPLLAAGLLRQGWRVRVSVVSPQAARAYPVQEALEIEVGALDGVAGVERQLELAQRSGDPYACVIDATHPFATRISQALVEACRGRGQRLLRLERPRQTGGRGHVLAGIAELERLDLRGERLLMAVGARRLAEVVGHTRGALHHARVLPRPDALRGALAAGLAPERIACLQPGGGGEIEAALCRHWGIGTVLCRQSGGITEALWRRLSAALNLRLLLLARPAELTGNTAVGITQLLRLAGAPPPGR
jgi:precorrin-6A/cobalt-precorrin-6A reductase